MKIISWNCNSATVRRLHIQHLIDKYEPDVLMLQETRCKELVNIVDYFIYHNPAIGGRNGVAILSRKQMYDVFYDDCGRLVSGAINGIRIICVYVPNGGSVNSSIEHKLQFFKNLSNYYTQDNVVVGGDFNVVYKKNEYNMPHPYILEEQNALLHLDQHMLYKTQNTPYLTWWDYRDGAFAKNIGYGLDKIYHSRNLQMIPISILYEYRRMERPSDHVPILSSIV